MKRFFILFAFLISCTDVEESGLLQPGNLTCEYVKDPAVVDVLQPRLAWINTAKEGERGQKQIAYQIRVATSEDMLENPDLWDSKKIDSDH